MVETEFNKWYSFYISQLPKDNCIFNYDAKLGWNACRDKVLEIIKEHPNINEKTSLTRAFKKIEKL